MTILFHAHSGLRYLVLLAGAIAFVWYLYGWLTRRPWKAPAPAALGAFIGFLDLQVLVGVAMWFGGRRPAGFTEHFVLMLCAVLVAHLVALLQRRWSSPGFALPFLGVTVTLALILTGIRVLGRPLL